MEFSTDTTYGPPLRMGSDPAAKGRTEAIWRIYRIALGTSACLFLFGVASACLFRLLGFQHYPARIFYHFFAHYEFVGSLIGLAFCMLAVGMSNRASTRDKHRLIARIPNLSIYALGLLAGITILLAWGGTHLVAHNFPLSLDEFMANFQAQIFASGYWVRAPLPEEWREFGHALRNHFTVYNTAENTWNTAYWPVYAVLRSVFLLTGCPELTNPVLSGISVALIGMAARQIWPNEPAMPWLAVGFLLTSAQFWATSFTAYAMPGHLAFNLLWLVLYLNRSRTAWTLLPWIGAAAVLMHKPNVHLLWAAPFVLRLTLEKRYKYCIYLGTVYAFALVVSYVWLREAYPHLATNLHNVKIIVQKTDLQADLMLIALRPASLSLLFSWQNPLVILLSLLAWLRWWQNPSIIRDLSLSLALLTLFYLIFRQDQGHGWGFRYAYPALGNLVLIACAGFAVLRSALTPPSLQKVSLLGFGMALLFLLPLRISEVYHETGVFARAYAFIRSRPADYVIMNAQQNWYAKDLLRNKPDLSNRPLILEGAQLTPSLIATLKSRGSIYYLSPEELAELGLPIRGHNREDTPPLPD